LATGSVDDLVDGDRNGDSVEDRGVEGNSEKDDDEEDKIAASM